ncbi:MAG TPA: hypothetical protein VK165_09820, partial [Azonexus sp.]|nr:hypothetical protein [Azonexus sp.]
CNSTLKKTTVTASWRSVWVIWAMSMASVATDGGRQGEHGISSVDSGVGQESLVDCAAPFETARKKPDSAAARQVPA